MKMLAPWQHFLPLLLAMVMVASLLSLRGRREVVPRRLDFSAFPAQLDGWNSVDVPLQPSELRVLGNGDFLVREYDHGTNNPVNLYLAYYPSQRSGDTLHSPRNCLPGAGWTPLEARQIQIARPAGVPITVNRYIVGKGAERMVVVYWYQAHGRVTASDYWARGFLIADSIALNRSDGGLVRILSSYDAPGGYSDADARVIEFARRILPLLDAYIPR